MLQDRYLNKLKELPEPVRQFGGLVTITTVWAAFKVFIKKDIS